MPRKLSLAVVKNTLTTRNVRIRLAHQFKEMCATGKNDSQKTTHHHHVESNFWPSDR